MPRSIHKLAATFSGVKDQIAASPPGKLQITLEDSSWAELMLLLYDPESYSAIRDSNGKLVVTRVARN